MILRRSKLSKSNSFFLFGPRGSGKTTLLKELFPFESTLYIDLLDLQTYDDLLLSPSRFAALIESSGKNRVIVDEIQKLPKLLDVIHSEIQKTKRQFILTGSSSRKLKQTGANLLAGRAWVYHLFPFNALEMGEKFDLKHCLQFGGLPDAALAEDDLAAREYLSAYAVTYLEKEIQQEQWVRNLEPFRKFLSVAAQMNGKILNLSRIASEIGINDVTVARYFEIVEDTLLGFHLPAYHRSVRKAQKQSPKFYFIDPGIKRALDRTLSVELLPQTSAWGEAFEHWVILEFIKNASYLRLDWKFYYTRTKDDVEIDLIVDRPGEKTLFVEIKSKTRVEKSDAKALLTLALDLDPRAERWLLSNDPLEQTFDGVLALNWLTGIKRLFDKT